MSIIADLTFEVGRVVLAIGDSSLYAGPASFELGFQVSVSCTWLEREEPKGAAMLLLGRLWACNVGMRPLATMVPQTLDMRGYQVQEKLAFAITSDQLLALDAQRGKDPLVLTLDLDATLLDAPGLHLKSACQVALRIDEGQWLRHLDQVGKELGITIRVPSPLTDPGGLPSPPSGPSDPPLPSRAQAALRLRSAREALWDGRYEDCARDCRLVLDSLVLLSNVPGRQAIAKIDARQRTADQRWAAVHWELFSLLSAAHHDDNVTSQFEWSRADAEAVLAAVAGLFLRSSA
jgi:hypothetical protein